MQPLSSPQVAVLCKPIFMPLKPLLLSSQAPVLALKDGKLSKWRLKMHGTQCLLTCLNLLVNTPMAASRHYAHVHCAHVEALGQPSSTCCWLQCSHLHAPTRACASLACMSCTFVVHLPYVASCALRAKSQFRYAAYHYESIATKNAYCCTL